MVLKPRYRGLGPPLKKRMFCCSASFICVMTFVSPRRHTENGCYAPSCPHTVYYGQSVRRPSQRRRCRTERLARPPPPFLEHFRHRRNGRPAPPSNTERYIRLISARYCCFRTSRVSKRPQQWQRRRERTALA